MQVQDNTAPEYDQRIAGVALCNEVIQHIFGFGTLSTLGRSASVCRFFNANVKAMIKRMYNFKISVILLKTIPALKDIDNMFESNDVPSVLRLRHELVHQLVDEEKVLAAQGIETTNKRIKLRKFSRRYAALGDIDRTIALLVEVDLCSLASFANCNDAFEKADRLTRIVDIMGQVVQFTNCYSNLLQPLTLRRLSECVRKTLAVVEPLKDIQLYQYKGFDDMIKQYKLDASYASLKKFSLESLVLPATSETSAAVSIGSSIRK